MSEQRATSGEPSTPALSSSSDVIPNHDDQMVRETWLRIWNNSLNPSEVSCRKAVDIMAYCFSPANQLRHIYRYGRVTGCEKAISDVGLCIKVKAKQFESPDAVKQLLRESRDFDVVRTPHVWTFRKEPPKQYQAMLAEIRQFEAEEASAEAAAKADEAKQDAFHDDIINAAVEQSDLDKT